MPDSREDPWETLARWFPDLTEKNWTGLQAYCELLRDWNAKINLVSRKDTDRLELKHLAHCLTITKFLRLMTKARLLDVGTAAGCPESPWPSATRKPALPSSTQSGKKSWCSKTW